MTDNIWTWLLFVMEIIGIIGMLYVGRHKWWGWIIVMLHSIPWFIYSITTNKPGFIAMSIMWWTSHAYNATKWRNERRQELEQQRRIQQGIWPWNVRASTCGTFKPRRINEQ